MPIHKLMVVGPNLPAALQKKGQFHVHTADCADLKRGALRTAVRDNGSIMEVPNLFEIVATIYDPGSFDWDLLDPGDAAAYWADFHFAPCVKEIPTGFPEATEDGTEEGEEGEEEGVSADDLVLAAELIETLDEILVKLDSHNLLGFTMTDEYTDLAARLRTAAEEE